MIRSVAAALALLPCLTASPARADDWFRIIAPDGRTIGWQREDGVTVETRFEYRVDGHERVRQHLRGASLTAVAPLLRGDGPQVVTRYVGEWLAEVWTVDATRAEAHQMRLGGAFTYRRSPTPLDERDISAAARVSHPMLPAPYDITREQRLGHIRYRLTLPASLAVTIPQTGEQRVAIEGQSATLDICPTCGPGLPTDPASLARWSRSGDWLESDAAPLAGAVTAVRRSGASDAAKMQRLAKIARRRLKQVDYEGHVSAMAAWRRGSGDCTEDAALLAALARSAGIPARVASGLVYERERYHGARDAFLTHAWTLAFVDGRWRSYDISIDGFDMTHIALAVSDGEPAGISSGWVLAAAMTLDAMAEVRTSPKNR